MPLLPELELALARDAVALWERSEAELRAGELPPPFWAFAWAGGQALARHLIDHPELVAGREVVDVACGCGVVALAAAYAGARPVRARDVDPLAVAATRLNARRAGLAVRAEVGDAAGLPPLAGRLVTAGDVFYDRAMAGAILAALDRQLAGGATVLVGDPYRSYLPRNRLEVLASYDVAVDVEVEGMAVKRAMVARLVPDRH